MSSQCRLPTSHTIRLDETWLGSFPLVDYQDARGRRCRSNGGRSKCRIWFCFGRGIPKSTWLPRGFGGYSLLRDLKVEQNSLYGNGWRFLREDRERDLGMTFSCPRLTRSVRERHSLHFSRSKDLMQDENSQLGKHCFPAQRQLGAGCTYYQRLSGSLVRREQLGRNSNGIDRQARHSEAINAATNPSF